MYLHGCSGTGKAPGQNNEKWCNNDYDALLKQGLETSDQAKRVEIYKKAQQLITKRRRSCRSCIRSSTCR